MRKLSCVLVLFMLMFFLTGCVKFNANMDIKKDKSMDFSVIYAVNTSILGEDPLVSDDEKKDLEEQGFTVTDYSEDNMKGIKIERGIKNIDEVSSAEDTEYSLSGILDTEKENENTNIFKVKKGFLKNTYIANFKFDSSDSSLNATEEDTEEYEDEDYSLDLDDEDYSLDLDDSDDFDWSIFENEAEDDSETDLSELSNMASSMELTFNVTLPYPAISNNATSTENDNKKLTWDLSSDTVENGAIEFQFELYNMEKVYTIVGVAIVLVAVVVIVVASKGKKNNTNNVETTEQTM